MNKKSNTLGFNTRIITSTTTKQDTHGSINTPIYKTAAFEFDNSEAIAAAFQNKVNQPTHTYTRISNPTVEALENKILKASGADDVMLVASGMAAISNTFMALAWTGSNIVTSPHLFGNTFSFFQFTLAAFGVEVRFVDTNNLKEIEQAIDENTCAFFCEIITNPHMEIADLKSIKTILNRKHIPLIVDTTLIPWCGFNARKFGVDIEIVSTTKYVSGGATSIGGAIVEYHAFDWKHNQRLASVSNNTKMSNFMYKIKREIARNLGACMDADTAYLQGLGMDSLALRYKQMSNSAYELAQFLESINKVKKVSYTKRPSSPYKKLSDEMFIGNPGAMLTFNMASESACYKLMDNLEIFRRATNLFDSKSLIIHPSSTIYGTFTDELKQTMGIEADLLRVSVGLEDIEDLKSDLQQAIEKS